MNLTELQQYVWAQTDTTSADLTGGTIEAYLDEAFIRTVAGENRWPYYEQSWQLPKLAGEAWIIMPIDMNGPAIMSVFPAAGGEKITQINQEEAEARFGGVAGISASAPIFYSLWAGRIWLWPLSTDTVDTDFIVRGNRKPLSTFDAVSGQVDADPRLHRALAHYAIALAYAQQEDDVLEARYMDRWERDVSQVRTAIMDPAGNRPLVMHGNFPRSASSVAGPGPNGLVSLGPGPPGPPGPQGPPGAGADGYTFVQQVTPIGDQEGNTWYNTATGNSYVWIDDGNSLQWVQTGPGGGGVSGFTFMRESTPLANLAGQTWFQTTTGRSFVWVDDGTSRQWVQFSGPT